MVCYLAALVVLAVLMSGCRPVGRAYSYLQYNNLRIGISKTTMTIDTGDSSRSAREFMDRESYAGSCEYDGITVRYPESCEETARKVARAFSDTARYASQ